MKKIQQFQSAQRTDLIELLKAIIGICFILVMIFFLCELGEIVANQYGVLDFELYQCDWYLFPCQMQQMFVIFMSYTQRPVLIQGYGYSLVQCTRENFKKVTTNNWRELFVKSFDDVSEINPFKLFQFLRQLKLATRILWRFVKFMDEELNNGQ